MENFSLNFGSEQADKQSTGNTKRTIKPGVHENVTITGVEQNLTPNGKKVVKVSFLAEDGAEATAEWSLEGGAVPYTTRKLKHLVTKVVDAGQVKDTTTIDEVAKQVTGAKLRIKFSGEEYVSNRDGQVRVKSVVGLPNFAESMVIPAKDTRLAYDPNNQYDLKKVNQATVAANNTSNKAVSSDLPF
jgi:hypothetical protein